ncbi:TetR/AcrR family transcriptional regulator [Flavicella sediminum]|uniref:TetR/AcrR family transcriptional regulator n=1 Tax=Flavicella sediminum TaxID=2585141 RepID=UPI00111E1986|nr:TetR/AcrR family transcriptional regulator [Flavicella sediminum]
MQQEVKSELSKQQILESAFKLFYENGFKATSINNIMETTSLTKGAFYYHYKTKKELGLEIISQKLKKRVTDAMILPLSNKGDALEILENTFLNRIKSFPTYSKLHGCPLNNFINEIGDYEPSYQTALKDIIETWKSALITLIERGKLENSIQKNISSSAVAIYLISAFEGIRGIRKVYTDDGILEDYLLGLKLFLQQLKKQ